MENFKLTINLLPKGAWNNDFSKTLYKKDWDKLREFALKRANGKCEICGYETEDLDVHEEWEFDIKKKTQTLKNIVAICSKCHGVKHFKNSVRLGYGEEAQKHFLKINDCSEMEFSNHLVKAITKYEELNKIFRWNIVANLKNFGGKDLNINPVYIPRIENAYNTIDWNKLSYNEKNVFFDVIRIDKNIIGTPRVHSIFVNNYQGKISVTALYVDKIEWFLDDIKISTKYNTTGLFSTTFCVKNLTGKKLYFKLYNQHGYLISKIFSLKDWK